MNTTETYIEALEKKVQGLIGEDPDVFLVDIRIKPTNNVRVYLDADSGLGIDRLAKYNRRLYRDIEESGLFPGNDFSLEVSSPGLDEPLRLHRQYRKNIGRGVEVVLADGQKIEGKLKEVSEESITVDEERGKNKKKEIITHLLFFKDIKSTKIQIQF